VLDTSREWRQLRELMNVEVNDAALAVRLGVRDDAVHNATGAK
jgi:hypothetical protein